MTPNRLKLNDQHFLKNDADLKEIYSDIPEALENNFNFPLRFNFKPRKIFSNIADTKKFKYID